MSSGKLPSKALLRDLKEVYERHNWPGDAIGLDLSPASRSDISAADGNTSIAASADCPPGQTRQPFQVVRADGTIVFGTKCI